MRAASVAFVVFEGVEVFQEEEPGSLLGVIEFAGATGVLPEDVVDVFKGLFKHEGGTLGTRLGRGKGGARKIGFVIGGPSCRLVLPFPKTHHAEN